MTTVAEKPKTTAIGRACALGIVALALLSWRPARTDDIFMYAATGRWIVDHQSIPHTDPFSWTAAGQTWQSNGWLWGVLAWLAFSVGGYALLSLLGPLFLVGAGASMYFASRAFGADGATASVAALIGTFVLVPFTESRPQMASYVCFALSIGLAERAYARGRLRLPWLVALAGVMVVWANLHGTALLGVGVIGVVIGIEALWPGPRLAARSEPGSESGSGSVGLGHRVGAAAVVAVVASVAILVNPYGLDLYRHAAEVRAESRATITEWYPLYTIGWTALPTILFGIVLVIGVLVVVRGRGWQRPELLGLMGVTGLLAIDSNRVVAFFAIATVVAGSAIVGRLSSSVTASADWAGSPMVSFGGWLLLGAAVVVVLFQWSAIGQPNAELPVATVDALPSGCRLLNDRAVGGFVLLRRPDIPVAADGRNDLYGTAGDRLQEEWLQPESTGGDLAELDREGVTCVLTYDQSLLPDELVARGWTRVATGGPGIAVIAPAAAPGPAAASAGAGS